MCCCDEDRLACILSSGYPDATRNFLLVPSSSLDKYIWINCFTAHSRALLQNGKNVRHLSDFNYHETLSLGRVWWHLWKYTEREKTSKMAWKSFESFSQKILNPLVTTMGREKGRLEHLTKIIQISITFCKLLSFTGLLSFCWAQQLCCCVFDFDSIFALLRASLSS